MGEIKLNSFDLLTEFIEKNNLKKSSIKLVKQKIKKFYDIYSDKDDLVYDDYVIKSILVDLFKLNNENLKLISDKLVSLNLTVGRRHKKIILEYLNYNDETVLEKFFIELNKENNIADEQKKEIKDFICSLNTDLHDKAYDNFLNLWAEAEANKDSKKMSEYLFGIFSRIHKYYNNDSMSLTELFEYNKPYLDDLSAESYEKLREYCYDNNLDSNDSIIMFYNKYMELLKVDLQKESLNGKLEPVMNQKNVDYSVMHEKKIYDRGNDLSLIPTEEYNAIYLSLNQSVFDKFGNLSDFYDYVLNSIKECYRILENNKVFGIEIENIYFNNRNLKWDLYAYLGIFAENFIKTKENRQFFKPEVLCSDMFSFYEISLKENVDDKKIRKLLRDYYNEKITINSVFTNVKTDLDLKEFKLFVDQWKYVFYGFTFNDCIVLSHPEGHIDNEINIKNLNHLFMIFYKYRIDDRKIPCPVCGGLKVSGNSYPEVGHKSWECKNIICSKRSKSNRGKRYSFKTNYMQYNAANPIKQNLISKDLISKWRKDIVSLNSKNELYTMFIKYFSFCNEKILFINSNENCIDISEDNNRIPLLLSLLKPEFNNSEINSEEPEINIFNDYFNEGEFINRFLIKKEVISENNDRINKFIENIDGCGLINGDSFNILNSMETGIIKSAVTSPPYYNARDYSQWKNLYLYLIDMYNIILSLKNVLKDNGVFLYNIGDINGNDNIIVKSNMGNKRLLLGAYSILLFKSAGYELVENIIWDKGEPQSKRSTNDGNFTPHYQKPVNAYEHMFIFKKSGKNVDFNKNANTWEENIILFSPVIKINLKGENTLGHTAPFPLDIPDFVAKKFNESNEIMLDPFSGSGTSVRSAVNNNIKGLGIELSEEYFKLSEGIIKKENKKVKLLI